MQPSLYTVKSIIILDNDGKRILAKYYDEQFSTVKEQKDFEKSVFEKTQKANSDILMLDQLTILYKNHMDVFFYVVGCVQQNEIMLNSVLNCLFDSLHQILRKSVEKKSLYDNLDAVLLAVDEMCDNGILLETEPSSIAQRVSLKEAEIPYSEQTVMDVVKSAKEQIKWSILR